VVGGDRAHERACAGVQCAMLRAFVQVLEASEAGVGRAMAADGGDSSSALCVRLHVVCVCNCMLDELKPEEPTHVGGK
jgi:hypothetical protein